jgi:small subunit ribosomal protein S6
MNEYELIYIVTPRRTPAEVDQVGEWLATQVTSGGGEVLSTRTWGRRRMAYPINHNLDGTYVIARLSMSAPTAVSLEKALHIQEDVIRHMLIRGIMGSDDPPPEFVGSDRPRFAPRPPMGAEPRAEMQAPPVATAVMAPEGAVEEAPTATAETSTEASAAPEVVAPEPAVEAPSEPEASSDAPAAAN